jgi:predicted RNA binding protein YcfA (HicA-like mRNA interferase family)
MSKRLFSSEEIAAALRRGGFVERGKQSGSHQAFARARADGNGHDVTIVVMGKKEVPEGTLKKILALGNVSEEEFLEWAKVKDKRKRHDRLQ